MYSFQIEIYEDNDNARKDEIAALGGQTATGINVFSAFYDRLKEVIAFPFFFFFLRILILYVDGKLERGLCWLGFIGKEVTD